MLFQCTSLYIGKNGNREGAKNSGGKKQAQYQSVDYRCTAAVSAPYVFSILNTHVLYFV